MEAYAVRMSSKYQIVIPKAVRESLHLRPQDSLLFLVEGDTVIVRPRPGSFSDALQGLHRELWPDPDQWLEQERAAWE
jgi:AbrB family looped-hinge helix DNA binding protein